eukprot:SAG11_NODE_21083_length_432_cov_1.264264_1_plen_45_part_01
MPSVHTIGHGIQSKRTHTEKDLLTLKLANKFRCASTLIYALRICV